MSSSPQSPPRRPRLSLQIKALAHGATVQTSRNLAAAVDVTSPTAFNTLSNVYATTVDRSTPVQDKPPANNLTGGRPVLRLQTQDGPGAKERRLHTPYLGPLLDTPLSAQPRSPATGKEIRFPSAMTATPPMSAAEQECQVFTFDNSSTTPATTRPSRGGQTPTTQNPKRRTTMPAKMANLPYTQSRSLRSILRNSPLPPLSTTTPISPRRQSVRLQEKAARRVAYNSPLCQTITTSKYTKSHVDLLSEDATPTTPSMASSDEDVLDQTMAYTGNETRDGGQTPGPFEEMRRRMTTLHTSTPMATTPATAGGIRKRGKKKEKKRRWVWTIGQEAEDGEDATSTYSATSAVSAVSAVPDMGDEADVPKQETLAVPVIALPSPRPRTRMQAARAGVLQIPVTTSTYLPSRAPQASTPVPPEASTPIPPASGSPATPEPFTIALEPPTPSVESMASTSHSSVFEASGDVEMSDASSFTSEYDDANKRLDPDMDMDMDMDMGSATPTMTARPAYTVNEDRGWAPWLFSMQQPDRAEACP